MTLFFGCVVLLLCFVYMQWSLNTGCWTSPSLFICRNTLVRGASVCSSCVLNAKRGSILQSVIDCPFVLNWSCFCVWQYSVVLPGCILRCVKIGCLRRGGEGARCPSCSACPQAVPSHPLPSCYATTSPSAPPSPPSTRPSSAPLTWHLQALLSVSMQKDERLGPYTARHISPGNEHFLPELGEPKHLSPVLFCQHFCTAAMFMKRGWSHQNTVAYHSRTLHQRWAFSPRWRHLCPARSQGRWVDDTNKRQLSISVLRLWEQSLKQTCSDLTPQTET